jgi:hypothetical protein
MNPLTQDAPATAAVLLLSTGETVTVPLPEGETVATVRAKVVLLDPARPSSRTLQHDALLAINTRLVTETKITVDGLFVDWLFHGVKGRTSLAAHAKEER